MNLPEYTLAEEKEFATLMSNWTYLSLFLADIDCEAQLLKMIRYEMDNKSRPFIKNRLRQRFNTLRTRREKNELEATETSKSGNS